MLILLGFRNFATYDVRHLSSLRGLTRRSDVGIQIDGASEQDFVENGPGYGQIVGSPFRAAENMGGGTGRPLDVTIDQKGRTSLMESTRIHCCQIHQTNLPGNTFYCAQSPPGICFKTRRGCATHPVAQDNGAV